MLGWLAALSLGLGPVQVRLQAPPQCPSESVVEADIESLLGEQRVVDVEVRVEPQGDEVVATVEYQVGASVQVRTIPGPSCDAVLDAVAVVVAVGIDPLEVQRAVAPSLPPPAQAVERPTPPPALPSVLEPASPRAQAKPAAEEPAAASGPRRAHVLDGFARAGVASGLVLGAAGWVGGGLGWSMGAGRVEAWGRHQFGRRVDQPSAPEAGADVALSSGALAACWTPSLGRFTIGACGGMEAGAVVGRGRGLESPLVARDLWLAAVPGLRVGWTVHPRVRLGALVDVPVSLRRPRFSIDDFDVPLMQVGAAGVFAGLSVAVVFFDESAMGRR